MRMWAKYLILDTCIETPRKVPLRVYLLKGATINYKFELNEKKTCSCVHISMSISLRGKSVLTLLNPLIDLFKTR